MIIILTKNHDLSLALDNHCQITEHSINQLNQLCLQLWAHWLSQNTSSVCLLKHTSYLTAPACSLMLSFLDSILFDSNFLTHFSVISLFDWSHSHVWDFDQIYCHKQLFCLVSCFCQEIFHLFCCSSCFVFLFEISAKSISMSCYSILCSISGKIFCLHLWISDLMQHFQKRSFVCIFKFSIQKHKFL